MKKWIASVLIILLLAVPAFAQSPLVVDESHLLQDGQVGFVEEAFQKIAQEEGFSPIVVTIDSFDGLSAEEYAGNFYDAYEYADDGILLLVSLEEGEWYILTNGLCAQRISDYEAEMIGEQILPEIREGLYYEAFINFSEISTAYMQPDPDVTYDEENYAQEEESSGNGVVILICMAIGLGIGILVTAYMASQMKAVGMKDNASDYVRAGSMNVTNSRDIFLYSQVTRTPKPKDNSSGGGSRSSGGGIRGGAGGRF